MRPSNLPALLQARSAASFSPAWLVLSPPTHARCSGWNTNTGRPGHALIKRTGPATGWICCLRPLLFFGQWSLELNETNRQIFYSIFIFSVCSSLAKFDFSIAPGQNKLSVQEGHGSKTFPSGLQCMCGFSPLSSYSPNTHIRQIKNLGICLTKWHRDKLETNCCSTAHAP